jgi:hypothetical protein
MFRKEHKGTVMKIRNITLAVALFIGCAVTASAQNVTGPIIRKNNCYSSDRLIRAAERDGYRVGAEGSTLRPDIVGAHVYLMYSKEDQMWGVIASAMIDGVPTQCDLGKGSEWKRFPMKEYPAISAGATPINKATKLCVPLAVRLRQLEQFGEVMIGRGVRTANYDTVYTMAENGAWSMLLVDKRSTGSSDAREIACFDNWGTGMLLATPFQVDTSDR